MRLIRQATTSGVIIVDPDSPDPIVIANPGLPPGAIAERAKPYLSRRRQLDLDRQLHGGMATSALYAVTWGSVAGLLVVCVALTAVWMVARGPLQITTPPPPAVDAQTPLPVPPATRPPHAGTKAGVWPAPPTTTTTIPPTTTTEPPAPAAKPTPPGLVGKTKVGPYGRRVGQTVQTTATTTLEPDEVEALCELLELPCAPDVQVS